jgi:hypothetical protein
MGEIDETARRLLRELGYQAEDNPTLDVLPREAAEIGVRQTEVMLGLWQLESDLLRRSQVRKQWLETQGREGRCAPVLCGMHPRRENLE